MRLYRGEAVVLADTRPAWVLALQEESGHLQAEGRWWTDSLEIAQWYQAEAGDLGIIRVIEVGDPEPYRVSNLQGTEAYSFSRDPEREFFLPVELVQAGQLLGA